MQKNLLLIHISRKKFQNPDLEWKDIYILPRCVTINTNLRIFQYKLFHYILNLNEMLYNFGKKISSLCIFYLHCTENEVNVTKSAGNYRFGLIY